MPSKPEIGFAQAIFVFPVDVLIKFNSGESVTENWDGKDRWVRYTCDKKDKLASAEIDPGHAVLLDKNFYNNSYVREEDATAKWKIVSYMAHSWAFCGVAEVCWLWVGGNSLLVLNGEEVGACSWSEVLKGSTCAALEMI